MIYKTLIDIGAREEQQDSIAIDERDGAIFMVVADGMGGHSGGSLASQTLTRVAVEIFNDVVIDDFNSINDKVIKELFQTIIIKTTQILKKESEDNEKLDPRTTCVLALCVQNRLFCGHIGDSRLYIFENNTFIKKTKDHSVPQMLYDIGEIEENEIDTHPDQNRLTHSVNNKTTEKVSFFEYNLADNFFIVLCTDGFWEYISIEEMQKYINKSDLDSSIRQMKKLIKQRGGDSGDNFSAIFLKNKKSIFNNIYKLFK